MLVNHVHAEMAQMLHRAKAHGGDIGPHALRECACLRDLMSASRCPFRSYLGVSCEFTSLPCNQLVTRVDHQIQNDRLRPAPRPDSESPGFLEGEGTLPFFLQGINVPVLPLVKEQKKNRPDLTTY